LECTVEPAAGRRQAGRATERDGLCTDPRVAVAHQGTIAWSARGQSPAGAPRLLGDFIRSWHSYLGGRAARSSGSA
jgi:hypothetical protein